MSGKNKVAQDFSSLPHRAVSQEQNRNDTAGVVDINHPGRKFVEHLIHNLQRILVIQSEAGGAGTTIVGRQIYFHVDIEEACCREIPGRIIAWTGSGLYLAGAADDVGIRSGLERVLSVVNACAYRLTPRAPHVQRADFSINFSRARTGGTRTMVRRLERSCGGI